MSRSNRTKAGGVGAAVLVACVAAGCSQVRYTESFSPEGDISRVVVDSDSGLVELVAADDLRVERAIRAPEGTLDLSHRVDDETLVLTARCTTIVPCSVDTRVDVPAGVSVEVSLDQGEVWATGIGPLRVAMSTGEADIDVVGPLSVQAGQGVVRASIPADGRATIAVGDGDIEMVVPSGRWNVDVNTPRLVVEGIESDDTAAGSLELVAPGGSVVLRGRDRVAMK